MLAMARPLSTSRAPLPPITYHRTVCRGTLTPVNPMTGMLLHPDRGVQYRSGEYHQALSEHNIRPSMSRKGNCWGNAVMESFFSRLKVELIYAKDFKTTEEACQNLFHYIDVF